MADSRETRQQELARLLLQKARQDLDLVVSAEKFVEWANSIIELPTHLPPEYSDDDHPST